MPRTATQIVLNPDEKRQLNHLAQSRSLPRGLVQRAQIVLACAEGEPGSTIAARLRLNKNTTISTTRPPMPRGSTKWSDGSDSSRNRLSDAAPSPQ